MQAPVYSLNTLFAQLGLGSSDQEIEKFVMTHKPLPEGMPLFEAGCWNRAQAALLKESIADDADWAEVVDTLDALLRTDVESY